jgi:hypothetical protein
MSFRWFIYYSAMCGGCAAFVGWALGRLMPSADVVLEAGLQGLCLGVIVSLILTLIDNLWNGTNRLSPLLMKVLVALAVAAVGGFLGGMIGQLLYNTRLGRVGQVIGWTLTGLLVGASVGVFDVLERLQKKQPTTGAKRKVINGLIGGGLGGLGGSVLFLLLGSLGKGKDLWTPGAAGFIALGILIGLMVGLAQVILKEAWLKVIEGFRAGRELILSGPEITIGRAEACNIGLFGDPRVEKVHARIMQQGNQYYIEDNHTPDGTYVNNQRVAGQTPLRSGDVIRVGRNLLRFGERQKQK